MAELPITPPGVRGRVVDAQLRHRDRPVAGVASVKVISQLHGAVERRRTVDAARAGEQRLEPRLERERRRVVRDVDAVGRVRVEVEPEAAAGAAVLDALDLGDGVGVEHRVDDGVDADLGVVAGQARRSRPP